MQYRWLVVQLAVLFTWPLSTAAAPPGAVGNFSPAKFLYWIGNWLWLIGIIFLSLTIAPISMAATEQQKQDAINKGLSYLYSIQQFDGSWDNGSYDQAVTGAAVLAFLSQKTHWATNSTNYQSTVDKAISYLLNGATKITVSTRNDDVNICPGGAGTCLGIYWGEDTDEEAYTTGLVTPALVTYAVGRTATIATTSGPLANMTWGQIAQGIINVWAASQSTANQGNQIGGWRYLLSGGVYDSDMSTTQWGIISLIYTQTLGTTVPEIVKTDLAKWLSFAQNPTTGAGCYNSASSTPYDLCDHSDTGGLLLGLKFVGNAVTATPVQKALGFLNTNWTATSSGTWYGNFGHPYAMWSVYKGLEVNIGLNNNTVITNLNSTCGAPNNLPGTPPSSSACNWWEDYNDWLVTNQNPDGSWNGYSYWSGALAAAFDVSILGYTDVPLPTLTITKVGGSYGTVTSNPTGINCGTDCTEKYAFNTAVTLTANPGNVFIGWGGDSDCNDGQVTMNTDKTCIATFAATPIVSTDAPSVITSTTAKLQGTVNDNGAATTVTFEFGTTINYGTSVNATTLAAGTGATSVTATISGLSCNTVYHYRVKAVNSVGTSSGEDRSFTTSICDNLLPPILTINPATSVTAISATLNGTVNVIGLATHLSFDFGYNTAYGIAIAATPGNVASSTTTVIKGLVANLDECTEYHYRIQADSAFGRTYSADKMFKTTGVRCANPDAWLYQPNPIVQVGKPFTQDIHINTQGGVIGAYDFTITFDNTKMFVDTTYQNAAGTCDQGSCPGEFALSGAMLETNNAEGYVHLVAFDEEGTGPSNDLQVVQIHFVARQTVGVFPMDLTIADLAYPDGTQVGNIIGRGSNVIISQGKCGDSDGNNNVNIVDALAIARKLVNLPPPPSINTVLADVNRTATTTILDAMHIARYSAGLVIGDVKACAIGQPLPPGD